MLATLDDVQDRLGRVLTDQEYAEVDGLLVEASYLVTGYLRRVFEPDDVPETVSTVVSRMVARVLLAPSETGNTESASYSAGPFSANVKYVSSGGSPWLTRSDKITLAPFRTRRGRRGGVFSPEIGW